MKTTVHVLHYGHAVCGKMGYPPVTWPDDHVWMGLSDYSTHALRDEQIWCEDCTRIAKRITDAMEAGRKLP